MAVTVVARCSFSCDYPDCRSTALIEARSLADALRKLKRRGWSVRNGRYVDERDWLVTRRMHYCPADAGRVSYRGRPVPAGARNQDGRA